MPAKLVTILRLIVLVLAPVTVILAAELPR